MNGGGGDSGAVAVTFIASGHADLDVEEAAVVNVQGQYLRLREWWLLFVLCVLQREMWRTLNKTNK